MMNFDCKDLMGCAASWAAMNSHNTSFRRAEFLRLAEKIASHMERMQERDTKRYPGTPRGAYPPGYSLHPRLYWWGVATHRLDRALRLCEGR